MRESSNAAPLIFEGGLAQVFRRQEAQGFRARKVLFPKYQGLLEFENLQRREFEILSRLDHAQIPKAFELHLESPRSGVITHVLEMQWIEGISLRDLMAQAVNWEPLHRRQLGLEFLRQSLKIFSYLESLQLIHADLSPENFILTERAEFYLVDFASACFENESFSQNRVHLAGKRSYRAPELHDASHATYASEIYSLGRIFEEILGPDSLGESKVHELTHELIFKRQKPEMDSIEVCHFDFLKNIQWNFQGSPGRKEVTSRLHLMSWAWWQPVLILYLWFFASTFLEIQSVSVNTLPPTTLCIQDLNICDVSTPVSNLYLPVGSWAAEFSSWGQESSWVRTIRVNSGHSVKFFEDFRNTVNLKE